MSGQTITQAGQVLEQWFFGEGDGGVASLRATLAARRTPEELRGLLILPDASLIERLAQVGITGSTAAALTLVPVLHVAWADGKIQQREREAILGGGGECGIVVPECKQLLEHWLEHRPKPGMFTAWSALAAALAATLTSGDVDQLSFELVELARTVAKAAGGIMGIGRISGAEDKALVAVAAAFGR